MAIAKSATNPQTLYEFFGIPPTFPRDLQPLLTKEIIGEGGWWYKVKKLKIPCDESVCSVRFFADYGLAVLTNNPVNFERKRYIASLSQLDATQVEESDKFMAVEAMDCNSQIPKVVLADGEGNVIALDEQYQPHIFIDDIRERVTSIALHPVLPIISMVAGQNRASLWDFTAKKLLITLNAKKITCDSERTCIGTLQGTKKAYLHNFNGDKVVSLKHADHVHDLTFHPTQRMVATASQDNTACLWNFKGEKLHTLTHPWHVYQAKFNHIGTLLATRADSSIYLWNCEGQKLRTLSHALPVLDITLHQQFALIASVTRKKRVHLWAWHTDPTLQQVLLRQVLKNWLHSFIGRSTFIDFKCTSEAGMPQWMATEFNLQEKELQETWQSMPPELSAAIFTTIAKRIAYRNLL
ncbi:MAG: WD40 repeat domain-containing protein [Candidatus Babeliales bacterium]